MPCSVFWPLALASGIAEIEGGGLCYCLPYSEGFPLDRCLLYWQYVDRQVVTDPNGRNWSIALMDVLGQVGDPDRPSHMLELEYASGRYFTLIYSAAGTLQWERGYPSLAEATTAYAMLTRRPAKKYGRALGTRTITKQRIRPAP